MSVLRMFCVFFANCGFCSCRLTQQMFCRCLPPKRVWVIAIQAEMMMDVSSSSPQMTLREVPRAARIEADHRICDLYIHDSMSVL